MRAQEFLREYSEVKNYEGLDMTVEPTATNGLHLIVSSHGRELAFCRFKRIGDRDLETSFIHVKEQYRGQGIAQTMYDYMKSQGFRIHRSGSQTPDGQAFWNKHKGAEEKVWESEQTPAQAFIEKIYNQYPDWPYGQADKVMVWGEGEDQQFAAFKLKPGISPDTVEIDWLMAGPEQRKGIGSRAIQELQRRATEAGVKLSLYPWGKGRISQSSLSKLYKRHGFKPLAKGAKQMTWAPEQEETVTEARIPYEIEEFLDSLSPDDVGVEEFGPYRVHFEGFTDDCQSSADYRKNPEAVYQQVFADFIQREGGRKPIEQNFTGDEDYPILYSIFKIPRLVKEVTTVPTVAKSKRAHLDVMPNDGRPIPKGEEADYLGDKIGRLGGSEVWQYNQGPMRTFCVFDPVTRISQLAVTGSSFPDNPDSLIIKGVYSGPENATRAANLYAWLVARHGLTLVSDIKQSEGGYRVWRELERRFGRHMNIYAFNTKTDEPLNLTTLDEPDTHVSQEHLPGATRDVKDIAKNVRLVASPK